MNSEDERDARAAVIRGGPSSPAAVGAAPRRHRSVGLRGLRVPRGMRHSASLGVRRGARTASLAATASVGESRLFLIDYVIRLLRVGVLLAIWRTILPHAGTVDGLSLAAVLTYTLIAEVFAEQLQCETQLTTELWEGSITTRLLQPTGLVEHFAADMAGRWAVGLCLFSLPLLLAAPLLGVDPRPAGVAAGALFLVSLALAICVGLALEFLFFSLTVALRQAPWLISHVRTAVGALLSGALIPLALLPWGIGGVLAWLPFASMASAPLQIYVGVGDAWRLLLLQGGWCLLLWPLALWLWRANREKVVGYGG